MDFLEYSDFNDYLAKTGQTPEEGIQTVLENIKILSTKLKEMEENAVE